jgi:hypothetical protein
MNSALHLSPTAPGIKFEGQQKLLLAIQYFLRCFKNVPLVRTVVQLLCNPVTLGLSQDFHFRAFWNLVPEAVC